jgi:ATP-dependent Lhr-like helicase
VTPTGASRSSASLASFSPAVRAWFESSFAEPTPAQALGWEPISNGEHTLILAPTGSGKTLAAFLWGIDRLVTSPVPERVGRTRLLYISPLRALAFDVEKNLRAPLAGIRLAAERLDVPFTEPVVGMRTGDTSSRDRSALIRHPPDLLITTPESLFLMLTSSARDTLRGVEAVIVDEIHALAPTKRGAHLALSLERLEEITERPFQRIGLSATQRPLEEIARFLGGSTAQGPRPVTIVDAGIRKPLDVEVVVPVEDMGALGEVIEEPMSGPAAAGPLRRSIWPAMHPRLLQLILEHRTTIVFCNARRSAERLAARLNELALQEGVIEEGGEDLVKAHHGSLAREQRVVVEDQLKSGALRAIVATSSLELGIDMGTVDLVIQVESPGAVSRGLQRIGRAGHQVGEPSRGKVFPKHRGDLLEAAVVVDRMQRGLIEETRYLRNPLDVLAQQIVAHCAMADSSFDEVAALVRRAAPFTELSDEVLVSVLELLAGRYPSEEFRELRPRLVWDRVDGVLRARDGARRLAVTNGGTIPDRGLFGVFLPDGKRVGELDEEMVYESRAGEVFVLGASSWRIEDITFERVVVTPAPGQPGKMPFWHGDRPGRPLELGQALGAFVREIRDASSDAAMARLTGDLGLDQWAADNVLRYVREQAEAGGAVPDDRTIVVERFRDEIGDWRVCVLTPFGARVHAPWAIAVRARLDERLGLPVEVMWADDGIVLRLPEAVDDLPIEELVIAPEEIDDLVVSTLPTSSLFASRFRECAARSLLLPRRRPGERTPLWQQRQRAADLLAVASKHPSFPVLLETTRECLQDVFDVPALRSVLSDLRSRKIRMVSVETPRASPFAQSLLFGWIAAYMYEYDAPLAERRAAALSLDRDLLRDLMGAEELRELIDPGVLADLELDLQRLTPNRRARNLDEVHDLLRLLGDLSLDEVSARCAPDVDGRESIDQLVAERRAIAVRVGAADRFADANDAGRLRDGLGAAIPVGLPAVCTAPAEHALEDLVARYAATHGPFLAAAPATRLGAPVARVVAALAELETEGRVVRGEFRPDGVEREWCDVDVLRQLRRRSLASLRREVEPVEPDAFARFALAWHGVHTGARHGVDGLVEVLGQLQGAPIVASALETDVLASRLRGYSPAHLDALCTSGDVVWVGAGPIGSADGRVRLFFRDQARLLLPSTDALDPPSGRIHDAVREHLVQRGASFWSELRGATNDVTDAELLEALWDLVWAGEVTNDSFAPLRSLLAGKPKRTAPKTSRPRPGRLTRIGPPAGAGRWSLVAPLALPASSATESAHAAALQLLERNGVLTREAALAEGVEGGFAGVYPVLKALEERGQVRRGYFVAGLGATQFALPGAVDRLRAHREPDEGESAVVLAATDPAQVYGGALPWPQSVGRPARAAGSMVLLVEGEAVAYLDRSGRSLVTFPTAADDDRWIEALAGLVKDGRLRSLELQRIDGDPALSSPIAPRLRGVGFVDGYRGLVLRS